MTFLPGQGILLVCDHGGPNAGAHRGLACTLYAALGET